MRFFRLLVEYAEHVGQFLVIFIVVVVGFKVPLRRHYHYYEGKHL